MSKSLKAFQNFRESLKNQKKLLNGDEMIKAKIIYQWGNEREEEILEVTLHLTTYEYGAIDIEEGKILMTGIVHLSFKLIYQGYKFTKDGNLKIIGRDSPLLGNYEVLIVPL